MKNKNWTKNQENKFKEVIRKFFDNKIKNALQGAKNPLQIGDTLSDLLKRCCKDYYATSSKKMGKRQNISKMATNT